MEESTATGGEMSGDMDMDIDMGMSGPRDMPCRCCCARFLMQKFDDDDG